LRPCAIALKEIMLVLEKRNCFELFQKKKQIPHWLALNAGSPRVVANRRTLFRRCGNLLVSYSENAPKQRGQPFTN